MFSHWKLGRRLIAGFLIVAAITAVVALIGYLGMRSIDADADALHYDGLMPVLYLGRAGAAHAHLRGEVYRLLLFPDLRDEAEQAIRSEMLEVDEQMSLFKATHMDEVEIAGLREFDRVWGSYQAEIENTIRQVRAGDEAGALAGLLSGSLPGDYTVVTTAIDDLIADTAADGEMIAHAGSQTFGYSSALAFGAGIAGTLLAIGLGYALSRSVTTPLSRTVQMIQEMGKGHLSARLHLNRRDEIGLMANALDEFADTLQNVVIGTMKQIAAGDLSAALTPRDDRDEIAPALMGTVRSLCGLIVEMSALTQGAVDGRLATRGEAGKFQGAYREIVQGVNDTIDALVGPIDQTRQVLAQVAKGDLNIVNLNGHYKGDYALLKSSIESMVNSLTAMALQSQHSAVSMTSATAEILASSTQMAASTREQASAVNQITATVQEIKASAEQVAQRARAVAETADQAIGTAEKGMMSIQDTIAGMDDIRAKVEAIAENILALSEQTQQIGDIIDTVTDIADQSNILALNAAIEAAQAGDAGRGFRVVADEVRSLAEQSRQAAAQVKVILSDIQKATNHAVMATEQGTKGVNAGSARVNSTEQTIRDITRAVQISAQAAQQIVAGVEQQTIGLDQIAIGMNDINHAAQQSAAGAHQSQQAARDLNLLAEQLKQVTAQYRL